MLANFNLRQCSIALPWHTSHDKMPKSLQLQILERQTISDIFIPSSNNNILSSPSTPTLRIEIQSFRILGRLAGCFPARC